MHVTTLSEHQPCVRERKRAGARGGLRPGVTRGRGGRLGGAQHLLGGLGHATGGNVAHRRLVSSCHRVAGRPAEITGCRSHARVCVRVVFDRCSSSEE